MIYWGTVYKKACDLIFPLFPILIYNEKRIISLVIFAFLAYNVFSHDLSGIWYQDQQLPENYRELKSYIHSYSDGHPNIIHIVPKTSYVFDFENADEPFVGTITDNSTKVYVIKIGPIVDYGNLAAPMVLVYVGRYRIPGWMFDGYLY
jgi:hypothetical protein